MRSYSNDPATDAALILAECVTRGRSTGWSGNLDHLAALEAVLAQFNVRYVDDMAGTWAVKK